MNADERFYCPRCLIPVEYSPPINRYICSGTCERKAYLLSEVIPCERLMDIRILDRPEEDGEDE